jgi:hypothetical protein
MIDQQEQYVVSRPRSKSLITGGLVTIFFGVGMMFEGGGAIAFGIFVVLCGILTLTVSRFGAKTWRSYSWWEWILVAPGWVLAGVFLLVSMFVIWLVKVIVNQWFG